MSSAAKTKLAGLFIAAKQIVTLRQILIDMGWTQNITTRHTNNRMEEGVVNNNIVPNRTNTTDMIFH